MAVEIEVSLNRALRFYLQQAPVDVLVAELKASAANARVVEASGLSPPPTWTSLAFQDRVATEIFGCPISDKYPPRREYVARVTKVLLEEVENAGDEPAEGLLLLRVTLASSSSWSSSASREELGSDERTAYESFWFPHRAASSLLKKTSRGSSSSCSSSDSSSKCKGYAATAGSLATGAIVDASSGGGGEAKGDARSAMCLQQQEEDGAFFSFRVANRDNEVGLRVWEAGRALAEFCLAHSDLLEGKSVLELGAGIGMTGMAVAASCGAREVALTDYAPKVLANLNYNVEINRDLLGTCASSSGKTTTTTTSTEGGEAKGPNNAPQQSAKLSVRFLDWTDYCCTPRGHSAAPAAASAARAAAAADDDGDESLAELGCETDEEGDKRNDPLGTPEVVLAADVVYDSRYHPALVGVVVETLRRCPDALIVFASTLRNSETMAAFHFCLEEAGVPWQTVEFQPPSDLATTTATAMRGALDNNNAPPLPLEGKEGAGAATSAATTPGDHTACPTTATVSPSSCGGSSRSAGLLWCHPGDLERVKFCVCGGGRGLVMPAGAGAGGGE